ncbi:MAG: exo-alpha-sialidase [Ruminococcaceae bacterium]|nr:exo-alpha-sialidase [Oscillospiraceae bacterium]
MIEKGTIVCSLTPSAIPGQPSNPRNSEGSFIRTRDDRILFIYSRFEGENGSDHANADIACIESADEGKTWSQPRILFRAKDLKLQNIMSVTLRRMANGDIGLFYFYRLLNHDSKYVLYRSTDEGATWSEPIYCIDIPGYYVVNNDRVLQHSSGRLIVPAAFHPPMPASDNHYAVSFNATNRYFISDDDGFTWRPTKTTIAINCPHTGSGLQEPGLVELAGGVIWAYARTDLGRHYEYFSMDGGETWTPPQPSAFTGPCSPLLIKRNPFDNKLYALWNPIPNYPGRTIVPGTMGRTPYYLATSDDNGVTWSEPVVIEDDPNHGYCYPAIHFEPDYLLISYCSGSRDEDDGCLNRTSIRRIELN